MSGLFTSEDLTFGNLTITRRRIPNGSALYVAGERVHLDEGTIEHLWGILTRLFNGGQGNP